jgi:excinuclease UvrABC nuclease subunit
VFFRQQQISTSINDNNVVIVLPTSAHQNKVEVFFIRHGRLRFQRLIGKKLPIKEIERAVQETYFDGSQVPQHCRKEEIDEIRIIASWVYRHRDDGQFLYATATESAALVESVVEMLYAALGKHRSYEPFEDSA